VGGIPSNYTVELEFGTALDLTGIPSSFDLDITSLPKIQIGLDPITFNPITVNPVSVNPLDVSVRLKEIPAIRGHIPANFTVGMSVLGLQLFSVRLCGEAQVITQPYVPNPCEICGTAGNIPILPTIGSVPGTVGTAAAERRTRKKG
jgi:hypothetical protein